MTQRVLETKTGVLNALTGVRWWAALFVFAYHMLVFAPLPQITRPLLEQGYFGVTLFFVLSGLILTWSARPNVPVSTFYWRRFARIWPLHFVTLLPALVVFYLPGGSDFIKPFDLLIILGSVVLIQVWWYAPSMLFGGNPAAWSLSVEFFFYALHPWFLRIFDRRNWGVRAALGFAAAAALAAFGYRLAVTLTGGSEALLATVPVPVVRLSEFCLGIGLGWALRAGWRPRWASRPLAAAVLLATLLYIGIAHKLPAPLTQFAHTFGNELITLACGFMLVALAQAELAGKRLLLAHPIQVALGQWSFAFYLVHATLIYAAVRIFGTFAPSWSNLLWYLGLGFIAIAVSAALYKFVEHPVELRLRRWKDRRDKALASQPAV